MTIRELLETKVVGLYFAGYCNCGCGEEVYDLKTNDNLIYQPLGRKIIEQVRPDLFKTTQMYSGYGPVNI